jgi:hypothetical protein
MYYVLSSEWLNFSSYVIFVGIGSAFSEASPDIASSHILSVPPSFASCGVFRATQLSCVSRDPAIIVMLKAGDRRLNW